METLSRGSKAPPVLLMPAPPFEEKASRRVSLAAGIGSEKRPLLSATSPADRPIARIEAMMSSLLVFIATVSSVCLVWELILCFCTVVLIVCTMIF